MGAIRRTSALYFVACLDFLRGLFKASDLKLLFGTPRNALSPEYGHSGALETLKWEVLTHPPYSPDIAPSDYYLFR